MNKILLNDEIFTQKDEKLRILTKIIITIAKKMPMIDILRPVIIKKLQTWVKIKPFHNRHIFKMLIFVFL